MKLNSISIYLVAICFALTVFGYAWFMQVSPNQVETQNYRDTTDKLNDEANKMPQAKKRVEKALAMAKEAASEWKTTASTRTPANNLRQGGIDLNVTAFQLTVDTKEYRNNIQRAVNAQVRKGGVKVINGPYVDGPNEDAEATTVLQTFYNYPTLGFPAVIFDLGTVTVQGTYKQIMDNVRAYKYMPHYLAVTDGLRIDGTSPTLTATYNLSIVGFLNAPVVNGQAPEGAQGNGGGAMGGMGAGFGPPGRGSGMTAGPRSMGPSMSTGPAGPGKGQP